MVCLFSFLCFIEICFSIVIKLLQNCWEKKWWNRELTLKCKLKCYCDQKSILLFILFQNHVTEPLSDRNFKHSFQSVTSAMLVMSDTPVDICLYMSTDIEARPHQFVSTMIIDTQAGFRMTFTVVLRCWNNARTSLIVSLMRCYSLNNYDRA